MSLFELLSKVDDPKKQFFLLNDYFTALSVEHRVPRTVTLELLPVCNFNCKMCYIRMSPDEFRNSGYSLMQFEDWKFYIDEFSKLGTEVFSFSGGECMLHPDFIRIYEYTYDLGKDISLLTNLSCLSDDILNLLVKKPPLRVNITVYGGSREIYENVCGNGSAFDLVSKNLDKLISNKIPIHLMSTLCRENYHDINNIRKFVGSKGLNKIDFSPLLTNFGKCDEEKLNKIQIDELDIRKEFALKEAFDKGVLEQGAEYDDSSFCKNYEFPDIENNEISQRGLKCLATKNSCSVNWHGEMRPCVSFEPFVLDPRKEEGGVKKCWEIINEWGRNVPQLIECQKCIFQYQCLPLCLASHYNDTHEFGKPSPRLCFKVQHPEEAAKLQAEYDRRQAEKAKSAETTETTDKTETTPDQGVVS